MNKHMLAGVIAVALAMGAGSASAGVTSYNQTRSTYFGSGNPSNGWTVNTTDDGEELMLRGKRYQGAVPTPDDNIYDFLLGQTISVEYGVEPNSASPPTGVVSLLKLQNLNTGGAASFSPFTGLNDNDFNPNGLGGQQNSQRLSFGFLNGNPFFNVGDIDYDANANQMFRATLTYSADGIDDMRVVSYFRQGDGGGAGIPEPSTWALMIMGFGGAGAALRRRRPALAA